jgi:hypothetical protein
LGVHFTLHALRWVYFYVGLLAVLVILPDLWTWWRADSGSPVAVSAATEMAKLAKLIVAPFCLAAVIVSVHVGIVVGRASRYLNSMDGPFAALRDRIARHQRLARRQIRVARKLTDRIDDDPHADRDLSALAHELRDLSEEHVSRPVARTLDLRAGERTPAPEVNVAAALP